MQVPQNFVTRKAPVAGQGKTNPARPVLVALALVFALTMALDSLHLVRARGPQTRPANFDRIGLPDRVSARAAGRGNPWINFGDGRDLPAVYSGAASSVRALEQNQARPLALAAADFDEDGVPDLISSYATEGGGLITMRRGNVDAIYPDAPAARQRKAAGATAFAPFLAPARAFELPAAPDFIGAGDFDADGHWDVAAAARGGKALYLMPGDGQGGFTQGRQVELPGNVTAMMTGEINRRDGLDDVIVGLAAADGAKALVFAGPEGALLVAPEVIALPAEATGLALGQLDDSFEIDLAIAAGRHLVIVRGRDPHSEARPAQVSSHEFPSRLQAVVTGDFRGDDRAEIAVLDEQGAVSVLKRTRAEQDETWHVEERGAERWPGTAKLLRARVSSLSKDDLLIFDERSSRMRVMSWGEESPDREAMSVSAALEMEGGPVATLPMRLNMDALSDLVVLRQGASAITTLTTQPAAFFVVGNTNDSGPGSLRQAITDANNSPGPDVIGFDISGGGVPTITPLSALPTITEAVTINGTQQGLVELNGASAGASSGFVINASNCVVRGFVVNNFQGNGIALSGASNNTIEGNLIGTDSTGSIDRGNTGTGIQVFSASNNLFGGTAAAARNVISGNGGFALDIAFSSTGNQLKGNYIGVNAAGNAALGNGGPVHFNFDCTNSRVGGTEAGAGNVISGSASTGLAFVNGSDGGIVQGNFIGTDATGTVDLGNQSEGVVVRASSSVNIGETASAARNVISGNNTIGVWIDGGNFNNVEGNFIGANAGGTAAVGNSGAGILVGGVRGFIGGNLISGNGGVGLVLSNGSHSISGNFIGTTASGSGPLGNFEGISIQQGAGNNRITSNTIAHNARNGIAIADDGRQNEIGANSIHSNAALGIDLGANGVTPNDPGDLDGGPNGLQNFPVLTAATPTSIQGTLNSLPNRAFRLLFYSNTSCDPSGHGEGATPLGSVNVGTDGNGNGSFTFTGSFTVGQFITATAALIGTAPPTTGPPPDETSEFSACIQVTPPCMITCPANINVNNAAGQCRANVTFSPTTSGNCGAVTCNPAAGSFFPVGVTTVTCTTAAGPTCSFTVTVNDSQPPAITCPANRTATAPPGQAATTVTYPAPTATDNCPNPTVACMPPSGAVFPVGATTVTCTATDAANNTANCNFTVQVNSNPNITITDVSVPEGNTGTTPAGFTVTLTPAPTLTVMVQYTTANGTATAGSDYQPASNTLTFNPGQATMPVNVQVIGDTADEANETFTVNLSNATNGTIADGQGVGTIVDDDGTPSLSINDVSLNEGNAGTTTFTFTVSLLPASGQTVTVQFATANGTATAGSDYLEASGPLTFNPGETSKPVNVTVLGDAVSEPNETFTVTLSNPTNASLADATGQGTILNDDGAPGLSINNQSVNEGNTGTTNMVFTVTLAPASSQTVTVNYATANDTATAGSDYQTASGQLMFNPGETSKTIPVTVNGDTLDETDETFFVRLSNAVNAALADSEGVGTILDDDGAPGLSITDASVTEGTGGTTNMSFTVSLSPPSSQAVTVQYTTANGTATAGSDYQAASGPLAFNAGETSKPVSVTIIGDSTPEANETFVVNLSNPVNSTIADGQGVGTILDDDAAVSADLRLAVAATPDPVATGGRLTYQITVSNAGPGAATDVVVNTATPNDTTFASISPAQRSTPPIGGTGAITAQVGNLAAGGSASVAVVVNVFAVTNSGPLTLMAAVTSATADSNPSNNQASATTTVQGGGLVEVSWEQTAPTLDNPTPQPINVRVGPPTEAATGIAVETAVTPQEGGICALVAVNIYKSEATPVEAVAANLWKSVPPQSLKAVMAAAPQGSFFTLRNVWDCNGVTMESLPSNEDSAPPGPIVRSVKVTAKLKASGSGFSDRVDMLVDGARFQSQAKGKGGGTKLIQKGNLVDGRTMDQAIPVGQTRLLTFVNANGGIASFSYTR